MVSDLKGTCLHDARGGEQEGMGRKSSGIRNRREGEKGGTPPLDAGLGERPSLQTFVICERVETAQDGVHTLHRIVDRFNIRMELHGPAATPQPKLPDIVVPLNFVLFARFGAGVGRFRASFTIFDPDGGQVATTDEHFFWLKGRDSSQNVINNISMPATKSGPYRAVAHLDGEVACEYVFIVDLQRQFVPTGP